MWDLIFGSDLIHKILYLGYINDLFEFARLLRYPLVIADESKVTRFSKLKNWWRKLVQLPKTYAFVHRDRIRLLITSEFQFRDTVENAVEGIIRTSKEGKFIYVNPAYAHMLGYDSPEEVLTTITDVAHQIYVDPDVRRDFLERLNRDGKARCEYQSWKKDGTTTWISVSSRVVEDPFGSFLYYESIAEDTSERRAREIELSEITKSLARSNAELQRFASVVAHDLNQPLRTIITYGQLLQQTFGKQLGKDGEEFISHMTSSAERMRVLIGDILAFSQLNFQPAPNEIVDMNELARALVADLETPIREANATVKVWALPNVFAHKTKMHRLLQNLISNAIKFRRDAPLEITIDAFLEKGVWVFGVHDNGIGFEQEHADKIFEFFVQLNDRNQYVGTGMGLAICKHIIELYGGRIWAESEKEKGTSFYFSLPQAQMGEAADRSVMPFPSNSPIPASLH